MRDFIQLCIAVFVVNVLYQLIKGLVYHIRGPSKRDFTNAVSVITEWIVRHNVQHPEAQIKYIQLSEGGPEGAALKVPKK